MTALEFSFALKSTSSSYQLRFPITFQAYENNRPRLIRSGTETTDCAIVSPSCQVIGTECFSRWELRNRNISIINLNFFFHAILHSSPLSSRDTLYEVSPLLQAEPPKEGEGSQ